MNKIGQVTSAWESLAADTTFAGMTLAEFKAATKPALDARDKVTALNVELVDARNALDDSSKDGYGRVLLVVNAVKGDLNHGEDSSLYEAMGYVRKSDRKSGLARKAKNLAGATPLAA